MKKLSKLGVILLASGLLLTACAKSGNSSHSSSTSSKLTASEQKLLKQATSDYKTFVEGEIDQLLKDTEGLIPYQKHIQKKIYGNDYLFIEKIKISCVSYMFHIKTAT